MKISKRPKNLLIFIMPPLLFGIAFVIVIASYSHFHVAPEVDVTATGFTQQTISVPEGSTVHFVNRSSTTAQVVCLGTDAHCEGPVFLTPMQSPPPRELLSPGFSLAPNQAKDIIFDAEGTFHVTSAMGPGMNLTVTVNATA